MSKIIILPSNIKTSELHHLSAVKTRVANVKPIVPEIEAKRRQSQPSTRLTHTSDSLKTGQRTEIDGLKGPQKFRPLRLGFQFHDY